jgi:hypothetical protein
MKKPNPIFMAILVCEERLLLVSALVFVQNLRLPTLGCTVPIAVLDDEFVVFVHAFPVRYGHNNRFAHD